MTTDRAGDLRAALRDILDVGALVTAFPPIVDLDTGGVVAFEALTRGPEGPLRSPAAVFAQARRHDNDTSLRVGVPQAREVPRTVLS